jgi:hypothetical protein
MTKTRDEVVEIMIEGIRSRFYGIVDSNITLQGEQYAAYDALIAAGVIPQQQNNPASLCDKPDDLLASGTGSNASMSLHATPADVRDGGDKCYRPRFTS